MRIELRGQHFTLLADRALFWEEEKVLIASDLHWGRESFLQKYGMPVPSLSFDRESVFLEKLFYTTGAKEWWILGDLIHHPEGLDEKLIFQMKTWMESQLSSLQMIRFIPGNHDRKFHDWAKIFPFQTDAFGIERNGFRFLHEPKHSTETEENLDFTWYGHLHPAISLPMLGYQKFPCFWIQKTCGFLPAFSRLAGGFDIQPAQADAVFVIADAQVLQIY